MCPTTVAADADDLSRPQACSLPVLPVHDKVVLVMDLVDSVRLMAANELAVIGLWRGFLRFAIDSVLPRHRGRLVKSLGDGILAEFDTSSEAAAAALELQRHFDPVNATAPQDERLHLRAGLHATQVYVDDIDIYGTGVNMAARVASLAGPGETLVTPAVRDQLIDGLDVALVDLGDCYYKHSTAPVRAYRLGPPGSRSVIELARESSRSLQPAVAVIPFGSLSGDDTAAALGDAIADDVIAALSSSRSLRVIARLSTAALRGKEASLPEIRSMLGAAYVISGQFAKSGDKVHVRVQLCATSDGQVLWADARTASVADIFMGQDPVVPAIAAHAGRVVLKRELERTRQLPLSNLESYTLYLSSITMLHRSSMGDFLRARDLLDHLCQRHPSRPAPYVLTAKWHLMRILQGWSAEPAEDGRQARLLAQRAMRCDPDDAFALATEGFVAAYFDGDLHGALTKCTKALEIDPPEAQVWRMRAAILTHLGEGDEAEDCAVMALSLTPLDPTRFVYELVLGASKLARGRFDEALSWAETSLRSNVMHVPTYRLRVLALALAGRDGEAREAAVELLRVCPHFSVDAFMRGYPGREQPHAAAYRQALRSANLPD